MPSLMAKISEFARSRQGRELTEKAKRAASDPNNRRKIEELRARFMRKR